VIATYPWAARVDAWVGAQLALLRGFRDRGLDALRRRSWYPGVVNAFRIVRSRAARLLGWIKARWARAFG